MTTSNPPDLDSLPSLPRDERGYEHWLAALESLVVEKGLSSVEELGARKDTWDRAHRATPHGEPLRTLLLLVVCVWVLGALASILKSVVLTGKSLVDRSRSDSSD